jgi:choloylglycine hydrolase
MINEAYLCSAFVLKNENKTLLGKNFDWTTDQGMVVKNIRNTKKYAYYTHNGQPATWISKYGSVTFNQNGKEMPYGGMNEKGLVVEMLWLEETQYNMHDTTAYVNELEWIQYQLDNFQSVDEVLNNLGALKIYPIKGKVHYIIADKKGKSVIIEYLYGKAVSYVKEANNCQAITNKSVSFSEKYKDDLKNIPAKNTNETFRYHQLEKQIKTLHIAEDITVKKAFEMLKSVTIPKGSFKTMWSIVYDISSMQISFFTHNNTKTKQINLSAMNFDQDLCFLDINQNDLLVVDGVLRPLTVEENFKTMSTSLLHLGFEGEVISELNQHQFYQKSVTSSLYEKNYFHFDITIPITENGKKLIFAVIDSDANFNKKRAVTGGALEGTTQIFNYKVHIYGLKNGTYAMLALLDDNRNFQLDFDNKGNPTEKYSTFGTVIPSKKEDIIFANTSTYFDGSKSKINIEWR